MHASGWKPIKNKQNFLLNRKCDKRGLTNKSALVHFSILCLPFAFLEQKHYFCVYFQLSLSTTFKNRSTIMKKYFFFYILLLLPIIGIAQTYKYIDVEDGLSNRRYMPFKRAPKVTCGFSPTTASTDIAEKISSLTN